MTQLNNKAIFWDRDGVLNHVVALRQDGQQNVSPLKYQDFNLFEGVAEVLAKTKVLGFLNIIITNQPDIARNKMEWEELNQMHDFLKIHIPTINAIYVCPHDNKDNCNCRKPKIGLVLDAVKDYGINLEESYLVGDSQKDIDCAMNAGIKSILVKTKYNIEVTGFDFQVESLGQIPKYLS